MFFIFHIERHIEYSWLYLLISDVFNITKHVDIEPVADFSICRIEFISCHIKICFLSLLKITIGGMESFLEEDRDPFILRTRQQYFWWPGNAENQGPVSISDTTSYHLLRSREVSQPRDLYLELSHRSDIWQTYRPHCCQRDRQISKQCSNLTCRSRSFDTSWDLRIRLLIGYRNGAQGINTHGIEPFYLAPQGINLLLDVAY